MGNKGHLYILFIGLIQQCIEGALNTELPKCWKQYGECLDLNERPLDLVNKIKPKENKNIIRVVQNKYTQEECLSECEMSPECQFYTLYSPDKLKNCSLVGFNLGNTCQRIENVCVLHRKCSVFDQNCGKACTTGQRLIEDRSESWHTLVLGGKVSNTQFEKTGEILDESGTICNSFPVDEMEGAAGVFIHDINDPTKDHVIVCGGWNSANKYMKKCGIGRSTGFDFGENPTEVVNLLKERGFFSMAAVGTKAFAFGGYNTVTGMLNDIEEYDGTTWSASTITLPSPRSHTCAVHVRMNQKDMIYLLGGWDDKINFLPDVLKFDVVDGVLSKDSSFSLNLPVDIEGVSPGRADMACMHYRMKGWNDGILITGGYRSSGAWLNTVWFLDLTIALNQSGTANPWIRLNDLSKNFDGGRHYHGMSTTAGQPWIIGGWNNGPLKSTLSYFECETEDITRPGIWKSNKFKTLKVGREKFASISVPKRIIPNAQLCN
ncbi:uncharacterized protein LOC111702710 [Eurytemora carolleeae]|uniref:uncharacterized protein LOC111702710 n=1 Tax=Eurytemora carolleeae TaxID=1294199 RepID=UPI000C77C1C3|nr:uncharacterized protein LOC111702710 [Eurytemora carolleeae]|eukprot:XP_023330247.1 uncharacterized protein LOC111702710 [Eurytemora affinis]